jgi:hypothetical protein
MLQGAKLAAKTTDAGRGRRAVLDDARRKVERALALTDAADDLARAAQAVLLSAEERNVEDQRRQLEALRSALEKYRRLSGRRPDKDALASQHLF